MNNNDEWLYDIHKNKKQFIFKAKLFLISVDMYYSFA